MKNLDYISWPMNGPYVDLQHPIMRGCKGLWCFHPSWQGALTCFDLSGNRQDGMLTSMDPATDWIPQGLDFDGTDDWVDGGSSLVAGAPLTMIAFVRLTATGIYQRFINNTESTQSDEYFSLMAKNTNVFGAEARSTGGGIDGAYGTISTSGYHLVVGRYVSSSLRELWVDGILDGTNSQSNIPTTPTKVSIGSLYRSNAPGTNPMQGQLALAGIWDRALTIPEIQRISADPFFLFRRKEIAYFFSKTTLYDSLAKEGEVLFFS